MAAATTRRRNRSGAVWPPPGPQADPEQDEGTGIWDRGRQCVDADSDVESIELRQVAAAPIVREPFRCKTIGRASRHRAFESGRCKKRQRIVAGNDTPAQAGCALPRASRRAKRSRGGGERGAEEDGAVGTAARDQIDEQISIIERDDPKRLHGRIFVESDGYERRPVDRSNSSFSSIVGSTAFSNGAAPTRLPTKSRAPSIPPAERSSGAPAAGFD